MTAKRLVFVLPLLALLAAGCARQAVYEPPQQQPPAGQQPQAPQQPGAGQAPGQAPEEEAEQGPPRTAEEASGPAVVALLDRAGEQSSAGNYDLAASSLERALDVEPRNPFIYHRLAALRLEQGQAGQAEALARKSNSLAVRNPYLQARNWKLIAKSRSMRGDSVGASSADSRAHYYQRQADTAQ